MLTMCEALGTPVQVGPRVIQKAFYGGVLGAASGVFWWGFSLSSIAIGILEGTLVGAVVGVALIVFFAFAEVMTKRRNDWT